MTKIFLSLLFLSYIGLHAQSFEGNLSGNIKGNEVDLYVWMDLEIPIGNGLVKGTYFYKTIGREIGVAGKKDENQILLTEKDKNQKITGIFLLNIIDGNLNGCWYKPDHSDSLQVVLYKTNPALKNTAKLPKLRDLLSEDIEFYSSELDGENSEENVNYSILFARGNLLSVELNWENYSYTAHFGTIHHTYNLETQDEISLEDELNDSCFSYLCRALQDIVSDNRYAYSDSEWFEGLHPYVEGEYGDSTEEYRQAAQEKINELFTVTSLPEKTELYLDKNGLNCYIQDYCEQYYGAGNREMTFDCSVTIPFNELRPFIKKESLLMNLFYE